MKTHYLIIGGGVAGTTAAETIRSRDKEAGIAIVSDEPYRFYSRIMLSKPNFFLEKIPFDQVWLKKESWYADNNVAFISGKKAVRLDPQKKAVTLDDGAEVSYEKLLVAVGGAARKYDVPGSEKRNIFYVRTLDDAKAIIETVKHAKHAVTIGGGFVSFEMCEMLRLAGIDVTLVMREPFFWQNLLDEPSSRMIEQALEKGGVKIVRNADVEEITGGEAAEGVKLKDGTLIPCEIIIVGIGIVCETDWLKDASVAVGRGILANEYLETSVPDVWVAGDVAEFKDIVLGEQIQLGNWVNAQRQGRTVALNMLASLSAQGTKEPFRMVSFYTTQGFGITIAFVGDVRPVGDRTVIARGSQEANSYARLLVKDGELIGATLINRTQELGSISKIIERDVKVSGKEHELGDPAFNLAALTQA
ncbi:hypothetical protein A2988_00285 [Candidatus Azambacteria bacterium RIFCSPLOWO2_01_FULL_46_25]|uniref:FAD/NAD(P)-binding domain-containing protein n=1 Tax=Candidatus Azambacteria bacterium RIFCSPLOWO2_01_FULL_46_25 TaxID=1797298 RepID=A0A1F5BTH8_9BACT|nr:MAG: hypothetical protein A2988_00285 [Candidatus Azambacteria bacterium RIFCSPLOWO2_01_FULL_46_25]